ncbi:hypothetical protein Hanom_Chr07g00598381 [Helianthus anomalus]
MWLALLGRRGRGCGSGGGGRGRCGGAGAVALVVGGRGRGGPDVDPCEKFRWIEIGDHTAVDWTTLEEVDEAARARDFIGHDTPWDKYVICYCGHGLCEFVASFEFAPRLADQPEELDNLEKSWVEVSFRLAGEWLEMSLREFLLHYGLYTLEETNTPHPPPPTPLYNKGVHMPPCSTLVRFWQVIDLGRFGRSKSRVSRIRDPLYRYLHGLIVTSIALREQSRGRCNHGDLFYLYCLV